MNEYRTRGSTPGVLSRKAVCGFFQRHFEVRTRRRATLGQVAGAATAAAQRRHRLLHQCSHIEASARRLREHQRRLRRGCGQQRHHAGLGRELLRQQLDEREFAIRKALDDVKGAGKQRHKLEEEIAELMAARLLAETPEQGGIRLVVRNFADRELPFVKLLAQKLTSQPAVVALLASSAAQPALVFAQSPGGRFDMGALMKEAMSALGGRGGGSRDLAQGGAPAGSRLEAALKEATQRLGAQGAKL